MGKLPPSFVQRQVTLGRSMLPGAASGRTSLVTPEPRPLPALSTVGVDNTPIPYVPYTYGNKTTAVAVAESGEYELQFDQPLGIWIARLRTAGTTNTVVAIYLEGVSVGTITLGNAEARDVVDLSAVIGLTEEGVAVGVTTAGTGAKGLVVLGPIA